MHRSTDSKILVVEDDPKMCESIRTLLDLHGFDVQTRATLSEAQHALQDARYDLVLLDLKLEEQLGFAVMDQLKCSRSDTRVIVVTGQHSEDFAITALKKGALDYLKKPVEPDDLIESVNTALDRQRCQRELELFKHVVKASSAAIAISDSDGRIVYTNAAYDRLIHQRGGAVKQPATAASDEDGYVAIDDQIRQSLEAGIAWKGTAELLDADGNPFPVCKWVDPIREHIGGASYFIALMCDMTSQMERERTVTSSRERYRKIIDSQQDFLYRLNSDFLITFVNQTYAASNGKSPRAMIGMPVLNFVPETVHPALLNGLEAARSATTPVEIEFNVTVPNGTIRWQHWRFEGIRNGNGELTELQAVGSDISVRKNAETRLQQESQKLKQALARVKRLSGMLPICASCKKIRDDSGYWNKIEEYIESNSDAEFSHGICPECARKLYPEIYE